MIKINLALRKQPTYVGGTGASTSAPLTRVLTRLKIDPGAMSDLPIPRIALMVAVGFVVRFGSDQYQANAVQRVAADLARAQETARSLSSYSAKVKEAEEIRKTLTADTLLIRTKINTIQKLVSERRSSVNLLLVLSDAVPADVWVTKFKADSTSVGIEGRSAGFGQVSDFIKKLSESTYLTDLNMDNTRAEVDKSLNSELATFRLTAKRRQQ